uniref:Myosin motor domain-containing protein n=1 Tax=Globisporangium ultimum (strain ATCC 200006 / CBS 805.95 / DAOM BR144) TaxID=431595 RepID=K3W6V0_GLOUD
MQDFVLMLQAQFRMYCARKQFMTARQAAIVIQRHVVARIKGKADRKTFMEYRHGATALQKTFRMWQARKSYERKYSALLRIQVSLL